MMNATHMPTAVPVWLAVSPLVPAVTVPRVVAGCAVAYVCGALPDIDCPQSIAGRWFPLSRWLQRRGRRKETHCALAIVAYGALTALIAGWLGYPAPWLPAAVSAGALAHSVGDSFNHEKVAWLWPISSRHFGLPLMKADNPAGNLLVRWAAYAATALLTVELAGYWPYVTQGWAYLVAA